MPFSTRLEANHKHPPRNRGGPWVSAFDTAFALQDMALLQKDIPQNAPLVLCGDFVSSPGF